MFGGPRGNTAFNDVGHEYAHILDPNERRRLALAEVDKVNFGWMHVRAIVVAGIGFFTDAYDVSLRSVADGVGSYLVAVRDQLGSGHAGSGVLARAAFKWNHA